MTKLYTGKCLCGGVTYTAKGPPNIVAQCHCEECRRLSGTGHSVGAMFEATAVSVQGDVNEFSNSTSRGSIVTRANCAKCGSPIAGRNTKSPDHVTLALGTMDDANELDVEVVIFDRDRQHWDNIDESVTKFSTQPEWSPSTKQAAKYT